MADHESFEGVFEAYRGAHRPSASRRANIEAAVFAQIPAEEVEPTPQQEIASVQSEPVARQTFARWAVGLCVGGVAAAGFLSALLAATPDPTHESSNELRGVEAMDAAREDRGILRADRKIQLSPTATPPRKRQAPSPPEIPPHEEMPDEVPEEASVAPRQGPQPAPRKRSRSRRATTKAPPPHETKPAASTLDELRLLREAQRIVDTRPARTLSLLGEHAQRFPSSKLALERNALRIVALCKAGKTDQGMRARESFLNQHGSSVYARRVQKACTD